MKPAWVPCGCPVLPWVAALSTLKITLFFPEKVEQLAGPKSESAPVRNGWAPRGRNHDGHATADRNTEGETNTQTQKTGEQKVPAATPGTSLQTT